MGDKEAATTSPASTEVNPAPVQWVLLQTPPDKPEASPSTLPEPSAEASEDEASEVESVSSSATTEVPSPEKTPVTSPSKASVVSNVLMNRTNLIHGGAQLIRDNGLDKTGMYLPILITLSV